MSETSVDEDVMTLVRTDHGQNVMIYPELVCRAFGAHALRINSDGDIELLVLSPEGSGWAGIDELPMVQTGRTRASVRRQ